MTTFPRASTHASVTAPYQLLPALTTALAQSGCVEWNHCGALPTTGLLQRPFAVLMMFAGATKPVQFIGMHSTAAVREPAKHDGCTPRSS